MAFLIPTSRSDEISAELGFIVLTVLGNLRQIASKN